MSSTSQPVRRIPILYFLFLLCVLSGWGWYIHSLTDTSFLGRRWTAALTMLFGSFIAGSSPEGSAAVSYPVFTLLLKIPPPVARNFSFAIQSIGMTAASLLILGLQVRVDWNYIRYVTLGGIFGLIFGTYYVVPLISPIMAKLFFVSLWLSFGITLWRENQNPNRVVFDSIPSFGRPDQIRLALFGLVGGIISAIFGTGINIFSFCLVTIYYRLSEKVATPSSVLIMTIETLLGFFLHTQILHDFNQESFELWLTCMPVVIFFAPLGAFVITKLARSIIARLLYVILFVQFIGAMLVIRPTPSQWVLCLLTLGSGLALFAFIARSAGRSMAQ